MSSRSLLPFTRVRCFDPAFSVGVSLLGLFAVVGLGFVFSGPVAFAMLLVSALLLFLTVSRRDEEREACVSLLVEDLISTDVAVHESGFSVVCAYGEVSVARLSRRLRRVRPVTSAKVGRRLPVVVPGPVASVEWVGADGCLRLERSEVPGALSVVDAGSDKRLEVVYGTHRRHPVAPLAVVFSSSNGAVVSWSHRLPVRHKDRLTGLAVR